MSECQEKAEEEFDIARIIEKQRDFRQEIEIIKHTLRMEEDPLFKEINPLGIINFEVEGKENFSSGTPINRGSVNSRGHGIPDTNRKFLYREEPNIIDTGRKSYSINGGDPRYEVEMQDQRYKEESTGRGRSRKRSPDR